MHEHINRILRIVKARSGEVPLHLLISIILHDSGKATEDFQNYLRGGKPTEHSFLSALYTLYVCIKRLGLSKEDCFWSFFYVDRHHSDLYRSEKNSYLLSYIDRILSQFRTGSVGKELQKARSIDPEKFRHFVNNLEVEDGLREVLHFDYRDFADWVLKEGKAFFEEIRKIFSRLFIEKKLSENYFWNKLFEFSLLLDADKSEAALKDVFEERNITLSVERIQAHTEGLQSRIKKLRDEAFREVLSRESEGKVFTLTLPTGMGKTLTGLSFALRHRPERVIYALPFLSVIEQVQSVFEGLGLKAGEDFIAHHHLTEYPPDEESYDLFRVLVEGWKTPIILTTFHQLFHTILPWQNAYIRRLNRLRGSFIILDEVQALPVRYWEPVGQAIDLLTRELDCKVLYMTATQPYLTPEATELVEVEKYRKSLNRYSLEVREDVNSFDSLVDFFRGIYRKDRTYLIVLNTIASSREVYRRLRELFPGDVAYLSTMLVPVHRKERIESIRQGRYRIVVSTQLIEAGVDLDFDVVIRDFAPLDSIVQSAGRANRNGEKEKGEVFVINLEGGKYARSIYDRILLEATKSILRPASESELSALLSDYFQDIKDRTSQENRLLEDIRELNFARMKDFTLIEEEPYKESIFVVIDQQAQEVLDRAKDIVKRLREKRIDIFSAKKEFDLIKARFYSYVINAKPEGASQNSLLGVYEAGVELYNMETGFGGKLEEIIW